MESQFERCLSVVFRALDPLICCVLAMLLENSEIVLFVYSLIFLCLTFPIHFGNQLFK